MLPFQLLSGNNKTKSMRITMEIYGIEYIAQGGMELFVQCLQKVEGASDFLSRACMLRIS